MTRYTYKVTNQGTRMDDAPLYGLVIIDSTPALPMFARTVYDELTGEELNFYLNQIEKENAQNA
jgi:hypothetical protein